jgi:diguanylate cyclase (GGDEF)-like protein
MTAGGKIGGLFYLGIEEPGYFTEARRRFARAVAEQLSLSLGNLRLRETLHNQSIRDSLTELFNYRYLKEALDREIRLAIRKGHPIGILMLDVDHFREFNNAFGHEAGNLVLKEVGSLLRSRVRGADIACRYGGEEFLLILPEIVLDRLLERAEQIRLGIKELQLTFKGLPLPAVTISIGAATFPEHGRTGEVLIRAADLALFQAKAGGRDRVIEYQESEGDLGN